MTSPFPASVHGSGPGANAPSIQNWSVRGSSQFSANPNPGSTYKREPFTYRKLILQWDALSADSPLRFQIPVDIKYIRGLRVESISFHSNESIDKPSTLYLQSFALSRVLQYNAIAIANPVHKYTKAIQPAYNSTPGIFWAQPVAPTITAVDVMYVNELPEFLPCTGGSLEDNMDLKLFYLDLKDNAYVDDIVNQHTGTVKSDPVIVRDFISNTKSATIIVGFLCDDFEQN